MGGKGPKGPNVGAGSSRRLKEDKQVRITTALEEFQASNENGSPHLLCSHIGCSDYFRIS